MANDTPYGLASGIQTGDMRRALKIADRIKVGTVWLNTWHKYHERAVRRFQALGLRPRAGAGGVGELHPIQNRLGESRLSKRRHLCR
jgi:acyl-CoA reductase-like NAD-dependent aldehyde dehydrogenase